MEKSQGSSRRLRWGVGLLGALLSLVLASTAFVHWNLRGPGALLTPRFSAQHFFQTLPAQLPWLVPFMLLSALTLLLRAVQWQETLPTPVPLKERYHLVAIGAFVHNALPGKLGDVTRAFLMARSRQLAFIQSLGAVAVCKLFEFAALMALVAACCLGPLGGMTARFTRALDAAVVLCLTLVLLAVLLARYSKVLARHLEARHRLPRLHKLLHELEDGLGAARSPGRLGRTLLFSLWPVLAPSLGYGLALRGVGIRGGLFAGPLVLGAIALGQSVLFVPAGTGLYYFVTSWTARSLGATENQAAAFAALTHLGTLVTQVGLGAVSLSVRRIRWQDLRRRTDAAAEAERHVDDGFEAARA